MSEAVPYEQVPIVKSTAPAPETPYQARMFLHVGAAGVMLYGFQAMRAWTVFGDVMSNQYGGFWQYLTILGLTISGATMLLAGVQDLLPNIHLIRLIKRTLLLIALPVEFIITSIYWSLIIFAPHLMLPPTDPDAAQGAPSSSTAEPTLFRIPLWMDMSMHLLPGIALVFEFFLLETKYRPPFSTSVAFLLASAFGTSYGFWVEHCAEQNGGVFPYPFLTILPLGGRVGVYVGATGVAWAVFRGLNWVHK
ncbi:hypothetical protein L202_08042 [Cryptococcus amylolentus CBS 6039]|uniref:FAR-17a/AIG1-like protein n=2 Tax=Cryptococcus amylolentus TaxID=104669 RepID=A0A1E3HB37_9TREE|nr:hypothetical protein L202_08042 [Cryptococcus amylolentus CBS 6039]ODN73543.1 hypothetical protein L202_08042 [Cryptococcus amylolentus CBS 6039]ODN99281.1 hypothetical protein I350_07444 [Cryptococcus amylolentus CBS 6273]